MRALKIVTVAVTALLLAGCTSGGTPDYGTGAKFKIVSQHAGLPTQVKAAQPKGTSDDVPAVYWTDDKRTTVTLVTYGSGSCPVIPTSLVLNSARNFRLPLKDYSGACTADFAAHTTVFTVPSKVSRTKAVTVTLDTDQKSQTDNQLTLAPTSILSQLVPSSAKS